MSRQARWLLVILPLATKGSNFDNLSEGSFHDDAGLSRRLLAPRNTRESLRSSTYDATETTPKPQPNSSTKKLWLQSLRIAWIPSVIVAVALLLLLCRRRYNRRGQAANSSSGSGFQGRASAGPAMLSSEVTGSCLEFICFTRRNRMRSAGSNSSSIGCGVQSHACADSSLLSPEGICPCPENVAKANHKLLGILEQQEAQVDDECAQVGKKSDSSSEGSDTASTRIRGDTDSTDTVTSTSSIRSLPEEVGDNGLRLHALADDELSQTGREQMQVNPELQCGLTVLAKHESFNMAIADAPLVAALPPQTMAEDSRRHPKKNRPSLSNWWDDDDAETSTGKGMMDDADERRSYDIASIAPSTGPNSPQERSAVPRRDRPSLSQWWCEDHDVETLQSTGSVAADDLPFALQSETVLADDSPAHLV